MLAYWKMLWLNRLAFLRTKSWTAGPEGQWKRWLGYALIGLFAAAVYALLIALEMLVYTAASHIGDPGAAMALAFFSCTLITLIYSFFSVIGHLFFGKDTAFLAALPIRSRDVMGVKLCNVLLGETGLALAVCVPLIVRHGMTTGAPWGYYARALLDTLVLPGIPVALTAALSFALIRLSALWKRREGVTTIVSFLFMALIIAGEMALTMNVEEEEMSAAIMGLLFGRASISRLMMNLYPPLRWLMNGLTGWGSALLFAGVSIGAIALVIALFGGSYMELAIRQAEIRRRENAGARRKRGELRVRSPFWALYRQEMKEVITVPAYATNCLAGAVMFPAILIIMAIAVKSGQAGPALSLITEMLDPVLYLAIATGVLSITCIMNMAIPTAVSREGARHEMRRTYPVHGRVQLGAKLLMGLTYNVVTAALCAVVLCVTLPAFVWETLVALVVSQLFSLLWSLIGLMIDVLRPKLYWKTETEAVKQSVNAMLVMLAGLGIMLVLAGAALLCWQMNAPVMLGIGADIVLLAIGCVLLWKWLATQGARIYSFKEFSNL